MATDHAPDAQTTALLRKLITALEDKKAENLKVLYVGGVSDITDYLILATGNSEPHLRALRIEVEKILDAEKVKIAGMESGGFNSGWTVVDAYQIMTHFFTAEQRETYALEKLWKDAPEVDLKTLEAASAPKAKKKAAGKVASKSPKAGASAKKAPAARKTATTAKKSTATKVSSAKAKKPAATKTKSAAPKKKAATKKK